MEKRKGLTRGKTRIDREVLYTDRDLQKKMVGIMERDGRQSESKCLEVN